MREEQKSIRLKARTKSMEAVKMEGNGTFKGKDDPWGGYQG